MHSVFGFKKSRSTSFRVKMTFFVTLLDNNNPMNLLILTLFSSASENYIVGHYSNDTFGPYFGKKGMGFKNMAHYWYFKKKLGLQTHLLNFGGILDLSFKLLESRIFVAITQVYFVSDPKFSGGHKIGLIGARDLTNE